MSAAEIPTVLRDLLTAAGPSGNEVAPAKVFRDACSAFAEVSVDSTGSSVARIAGRGEGHSLAIVGHIDEIGLMVTHIDDDGFLWFGGVGGWDPVILVGQRVEVETAGGVVPGVVGKKPIHLLESEEREKAPKLKHLHIDVGARDGDEARGLVSIGDVAVIAGEPVILPNGRAVSRAMDNRLGCYIAYESARLIADAGGAPGDVYAVAVVQEETTLGGAATTAFSLQPDVAIAVDVGHATDAPGVEEKQLGRHPLGSGAIVTRGSTLSPRLSALLLETATAEGIEHTVEASPGRTSTDGDAFFAARGGIPTGLISIPLRYMHSPVEMVQLSDVEGCAQLIAAVAQRLTADVSFAR